jgi:hypothetical protein
LKNVSIPWKLEAARFSRMLNTLWHHNPEDLHMRVSNLVMFPYFLLLQQLGLIGRHMNSSRHLMVCWISVPRAFESRMLRYSVQFPTCLSHPLPLERIKLSEYGEHQIYVMVWFPH